jgi:hypothetical protein
MKKTLIPLLLLSASVCVAQRHPYNSRPYHPPDRQSTQREIRRQQPLPQQQQKPQPVNTPAPRPDKRGK